MDKTLVFSFVGASCAVVILAAGWAVLMKQLLECLKRDHPSTFEQLGSPRVGGNLAEHRTSQLLSFLIRRKDRQLDDAALSRHCQIMFWWWWVFLLMFVMMLITMVWMQRKLGVA